MYSKKINQLATNLNPQNDDLLPIGDAETGQLKTTTFGSVSGITGDGVISGGIVTWTGTGLIFDISACTYILNGVRYTSPFTTKTLAAADPTNPRIDVFAVNTSGQVEVIQGTPNANPVEPEGDTPTTLGLTNVTINAGASTPNGVTKDMIYDENVETWTQTQSVTGSFDYNNTAFAYTGTKSLLVTMSAGFANFTFSKAVAMDISNYKSLSFAIRLNTAWTSNTILTVRFQNGTNNVTNLFQINSTNNVGFNRNLAGQWQLITIPFNNTNLRFTNNAFTAIRIGTQNAAATYRLDTISLNGGINNPGGGTTTPSNSFGFVNGTTGTASSTTATDTLNVVGTGIVSTSATAKTLTIATPNISTSTDAVIKLDSTTKGFLPTRMTETQKNAISTPSIGLMIYQTDGTEGIYQYKSTGWAIVGGGGGNTIYTGDGTLTGDRTITSNGYSLTILGGKVISTTEERALILSTSTTNKATVELLLQNTFTTTGKTWRFRSTSAGDFDITNTTTNRAFLITSDGKTIINGSSTISTAILSVTGSIATSAGLQVQGGVGSPTGAGIEIEYNAGTAYFTAYNRTGAAWLPIIIRGSQIDLTTAGSTRARITNAGRLLIGTTTESTFILDVNGEARVNVLNLKNDSSIAKSTSATYKYLNGFNFYNTSSGDINFLNDFITGKINFGAGQTATAQMTLNANGTLTLANVGINRSGTSGTASIAIGTGTGATASGSSSIAIGNQVSASGTNSIAIGERATAAQTSAISIGYFVFGAANTFVCGSFHANITNVYFGNGYQADQFSTTAGVSYTINGSGGFGSNQNGGNITIAGGKGTGTGTSADIIFSTATTTTSGSTLQTLTQRWWIKGQTGALSNVASPNASAITQIDSTTQGFLPPRMTTTQKNAIASPAAGLQVYDTTLNQMSYYNGTTWVNF
jgi:hypothetical protein